jgi:hypothetical protein
MMDWDAGRVSSAAEQMKRQMALQMVTAETLQCDSDGLYTIQRNLQTLHEKVASTRCSC